MDESQEGCGGQGATVAGFLAGASASSTLLWIVPGLMDLGLPVAVAMALYVALVIASAGLVFRCSPFETGSPGAVWPVAAGSAWLAPATMFTAGAPALAALAAAIFGVSAAYALARPSRTPVSALSRVELFQRVGRSSRSGRHYRLHGAVSLLYVAAALVIFQLTGLGVAFIVAATTVFAWPADSARRPPRHSRHLASGSLALGLTLIAAWPSGWGGRIDASKAPDADKGPSAQTGGQYNSIILVAELPPALDETVHAPTLGDSARQARSHSSIPFSGVYWFFYRSRPGLGAFIKIGDPRTSSYQSTDSTRLRMEGRQLLDPPLDLGCCRGISVVLKSREPELDEVAVELILAHPSFDRYSLGAVWLDSAVPSGNGPLDGNSVASFSVPTEPLLREADQLIVRFHLPDSLGGRSARIAIDRFDLLP